MEYEAIIGLEIHTQLKTKTKIFCGCSTEFGAAPNKNTCPVCLGMPGVLPVLNKKVVEYAMKMAVATNCTISKQSRFARKNYFYPDLPKGYQISQYELPIAENGFIDIQSDDKTKKIGITRIHMEEDAGKLIHDQHRPVSMVDFNRTGVPLIEIVSEPDIRNADEAGAYLRKIHALVRYIGISDGNMEEGSFRCDANVSIRPKGEKKFGTRAELKNLNSFKNVEKAISYEIQRQKYYLDEKKEIVQETRLFDANTGKTHSMRGKEEAHDYRYFPDPDLLPLIIDDKWIDDIKNSLPELPDIRKNRFIKQFMLPEYDADILTSSRELAQYFEDCLKDFNKPKLASNWIMGNLLGLLNNTGKTIDQSPVSPQMLASLLKLVDKNVINDNTAKKVFEQMAESGDDPQKIVKDQGLMQVSDNNELNNIVDKILISNPKEVEAFKNGKKKLLSFFMGQVMRETKGKANPKAVNEILKNKLQ